MTTFFPQRRGRSCARKAGVACGSLWNWNFSKIGPYHPPSLITSFCRHCPRTDPAPTVTLQTRSAPAYGINSISYNGTLGDGSGQTIAIVDAYNDPVIFNDLDGFDQGTSIVTSGPSLYQQYGAASTFLTVYNQNGQVINPASTKVRTDPMGPGTNNWEGEEVLDVEWAHAIAPGAKIDLIECNNNDTLYPQALRPRPSCRAFRSCR